MVLDEDAGIFDNSTEFQDGKCSVVAESWDAV